MSDISYRLLVDLSAKGSLSPQLDKMQSQAKGLDSSLKGLGSSLSSGLGAALGGVANSIEGISDRLAGLTLTAAKFGAAGAVAGAAYGVKLNEEAEKTTVALAGVFKAQGVSNNMTEGLEVATAAMEKMRIHARDLPGELKDLQQIFLLSMTPGLQLGGSVGQLERMSANAMAAMAGKLPMDQTARELAQLYQGHAGGHNAFGQMLGFSGDDAKKLNAATGESRLKVIEDALKKYEDSIPVYAKTFDALTSTLKDNADQTVKRVMKPTFDSMKAQLERANHWFGDHEDQVGRFADNVGHRLEHAFTTGQRKIEEWAPAVSTFAHNAEERLGGIWDKAGPMLTRIEHMTLGALQDPKTLDRLESFAKLYAGVKIGNQVAPMASAAGKGLSSMMGPGLEMLGIGGLEAGLLGAGIAAADLAATLTITASVMHVLSDKTSELYTVAHHALEQAEKNGTQAANNLDKAWQNVKPTVEMAENVIGTVFLVTLENFTIKLNDYATMIRGATDLFSKPVVPPPREMHSFERDVMPFAPFKRDADPWNLDDLRTKKGAGGGGGGTTIQKVEIVVSTNQDPNRVARLTVDRLMDVSRFPKSSPNARNWSAERP